MEKTAIVQKMNEAITAGDAEQFQAAFVELCDKIQESVIEQARGIVEEADQRILSERGVRQLTSKNLSGRHRYDMVVYSKKPEYRITHLLEKGHAKRNGGRVDGIPHIKIAEKHAKEILQERIERYL